MNSSTSPSHKAVIFDTNVLSLFARVNHLNLLPQYFTVSLYITPAIQRELEVGIQNDVFYLKAALKLIRLGHLQVIRPKEVDRQFISNLPAKLASGEAEAIALCHRHNMVFVTYDRKAINYCDRAGISCIPLTDLLAEFQDAGLLTTSEIQRMLF